jgi:uncharacterized protein DUF2851
LTPPSENFYAQWRARACARDFLRDEQFPAERLVQAIWQHQRLRRGELKTIAGQPLRVFHPGFASLEGGPDFRGAVLQIGSDAPCSGDVEVDLRAAGWRAHGHDVNPSFKNVLLHVIWEDEGGQTGRREPSASSQTMRHPPILALKNILDAPLMDLSLALENESLRSLPEHLRGKCCAPLRQFKEPELWELLKAAAGVRLESKAAQFRTRARNAGWEQALWENLFRALGYKHNVWPMQHLAEQLPRLGAAADLKLDHSAMLLAWQARLLGLAGLLPAELNRKSQDTFPRKAWDFWWRERDGFSDILLPKAAWKFHGLRPANHPSRRLALAAHWLADGQFIAQIEKWIVSQGNDGKWQPPAAFVRSLLKILQVERDDFWSWHTTFRSARLKRPQPLLGEARATDLAVNVILPWLWIRAVEGGNAKIRDEVERRFFAWPAAEDNAILKLARQRLLGTSSAKMFKTAAAQQGLMQIVRDFCDQSNAACDHCKFPDLVRGHMWTAKKSQ